MRNILVVLLLLQVLLTGGLWWLYRPVVVDVNQTFLTFDQSAVNQIQIRDLNKVINLKKSAGQWQLSDIQALPLNQQKVAQLLLKMVQVKAGFPVLQQQSAHQRFKVADETFIKKVTLSSEQQTLADFWLGEPAGLRQTYARLKASDQVYAVNLNELDFSVNHKGWMDQTIFMLDDIQVVEADRFRISRDAEGNYIYNSLTGDNEGIEQAKIISFIQALKSLLVIDIADKSALADSEVVMALKVRANQEMTSYEFINTQDDFYLRHSSFDLIFKISQQTFDTLNFKEALIN